MSSHRNSTALASSRRDPADGPAPGRLQLWAELRELASRGREVWSLAPPVHRRRLASASLLMSLASAANTATALLMGVLVDRVTLAVSTGSRGVSAISGVLAAMASIYLGREICHVLRRSLVERSSAEMHRDLLLRLTGHALRMDLQLLGSQRIGALHGRIVRSVDGFVRFVRLMFLDCLPAVTTGAIAITATLVKQPMLGVAMLGVAPLTIWLTLRQIQSQKNVRLALLRDYEAVDALVVEQLGGAEFLQIADSVNWEVDRLRTVAEARRSREVRYHFEMSLFGSAKALNEALFHLVTLGVSAWLALDGRISVGDVLTFSVLFLNVMAPLSELHRILDEGHEAGLRVADLTSLLAQPEDRSYDASDSTPPRIEQGRPAIQVAHLSLAYRGADGHLRRALDDVSLTIRHGETIGLAGPSGSGKSTFVKVLLRALHPDAGVVEIFGQPLESLSRSGIAGAFGYVGQNPFVFSGTVAENIAYAHPGASRAEIEHAARKACLHEEILNLPRGYDEPLVERGGNLSGGQKQRLSLARVFLNQPPIWILDEATSALDNFSELEIQKALEELEGSRTLIMIAHRLTTLRRCDRIYVFDDGKVVETGTYTGLLGQSGLFATLVRSADQQPAS